MTDPRHDPAEKFKARCEAKARLVNAFIIRKADATDDLQRSATESGLVEAIGQDQVQKIMNDAFKQNDEQQNNGDGRAEPPQLTGLGEWDAGDDVDKPPPRGWLLGNIFCRTFVSSLLADGGVGKTALRTAQWLSLTTGRSLTGEHVFQRCRVLVICLEDDDRELRRRVLAARLHFDISLEDVKGRLFLSAPGAASGKLMTSDRFGKLVRGNFADKIEAVIRARQIDLVSIDPFVKSHSLPENENTAIDEVVQILIDLAAKYDIAIDVPHHTSKGPADPGNASRGRGASAMVDAGRLIYTLTVMSTDEAKAFAIPEGERYSYIRMDSGKANITKHMLHAKWFRLVGVQLDNATELYPNGDNVQTVEPWTPPDVWEHLSIPIINRILDDIDAGLPDGARYTDANKATTRAAWRVILKHVPEKTKMQAREVIKKWVETGLLEVHGYENPKTRKEENGLRVNSTKRPT